jgi:hypothetical protein
MGVQHRILLDEVIEAVARERRRQDRLHRGLKRQAMDEVVQHVRLSRGANGTHR